MALMTALLERAREKGRWYWVCYIVITCLVVLTALLIWLIYKAPIYTIEQFDVFAPNKTTNSTPVIIYDLMLKNKNLHQNFYYDDLDLTFYYKKPSSSFIPIGNAHFGFLYLRHRRSVHRVGQLQPSGVNWENSTAVMVFKVELKTSVRYKNIVSRLYHYVKEAELRVNDEGHLVKGDNNDGIKLVTSGAPKIKGTSFRIWAVLGVLIIILLQ